MLILRDMKFEDIEDYVRWSTVQTTWVNMDDPQESFGSSAEEEQEEWTE